MNSQELQELECVRIMLGIVDENNPLYKFIRKHEKSDDVTHIYEGMYSNGMGVLDLQ